MMFFLVLISVLAAVLAWGKPHPMQPLATDPYGLRGARDLNGGAVRFCDLEDSITHSFKTQQPLADEILIMNPDCDNEVSGKMQRRCCRRVEKYLEEIKVPYFPPNVSSQAVIPQTNLPIQKENVLSSYPLYKYMGKWESWEKSSSRCFEYEGGCVCLAGTDEFREDVQKTMNFTMNFTQECQEKLGGLDVQKMYFAYDILLPPIVVEYPVYSQEKGHFLEKFHQNSVPMRLVTIADNSSVLLAGLFLISIVMLGLVFACTSRKCYYKFCGTKV